MLSAFLIIQGVFMPSPVLNRSNATCSVADYPRVKLVKNPDAENGVGRSILKFFNSSEAVFRMGQLMDKLPKWGNEVRESLGMGRYAPMDTLSSKGLTAWTWGTTFLRIPQVIDEAVQENEATRLAISNDALTGAQVDRQIAKSASATTEAVSMACHGASMTAGLFPQTALLSKMFTATAETVGLAHDAIEFGLHKKNLELAYSMDLAGATSEMKEAVQQTKDNNWIAVAKDVCSVFSGIFGFLCAVTGLSFLSNLTAATLSLGSTAFAVTRKIHEMNMSYKPINFVDARLLV